jgi:hypothetical protein
MTLLPLWVFVASFRVTFTFSYLLLPFAILVDLLAVERNRFDVPQCVSEMLVGWRSATDSFEDG